MKDFLAFFFKGAFLFLTKRPFRTFVWLYFQNSFIKRFRERKVSVDGFKVSVADMKSFVYQYLEIFVYEFYAFKANSDQPVIYDCGSNVGTSILYFKKQYPRSIITAYEPSPNIYRLLDANVKKNNLSDIKLKQQAVWTKNETLTFNDEGADGGSIYSVSNAPKVSVEAIDFIEVLQKESKIDFLKIDIEGAEHDLIPHIAPALNRVENIFIEYHSFNGKEQKLDKILAILTQHHFRYFIRHSIDRKTPFINKKQDQDMDMQLNIFGYKN